MPRAKYRGRYKQQYEKAVENGTLASYIQHESRETRLCLRPERIPGVAPPCEDDNLVYGHVARTNEYKRASVTLPKLAWMDRNP